ncbi:MAG: RecQ family ATP-dependent DNA helicase [Bacteroidales bacterium]|nr:RecQ family ATP-dependent DNA helicase [Bacteroidales bacterium]MBN2757213.1 RecQ family ATP-dependent DNA helicase [Bacteroidales bacterium]
MNKFEQILLKNWGFSSFRPLQEDIIKSVSDNSEDTLALLPTGGGKSIIFQVAALSKEGLCIVITPLIALMKDQVKNLKTKQIKAEAIYSGMTKHEIDIVLNNCVYGAYKFLYLSPERLTTDIFLARISKMNINLIAVDEAHCISQWGYDFRPAYLEIANIRNYIPDVPVLALTATATKDVIKDIQEKLLFHKENIFKKSFERKNLVYLVRNVEDKFKHLLRISQKINGCGIVYVRNRKKTKEIAQFLQNNKISADYYHAGLEHNLKDFKQNQWTQGRTRIIVATNAFGMGIDKPDVRFVVHIDLPDSLEAYYQEAGRAGRDEKKAFAILLYNKTDNLNIEKRIRNAFPEKELIKRVYIALGNYYQLPVGAGKGNIFNFKITDFATKFNLPILQTYSSLKLLEQEKYIELTEDFFSLSKVIFITSQQDLYKFQVANKKIDSFIKIILRTYAGIFSTYVNIDEEYLAKILKTKVDIIYDYLQKLAQANIIKYIPQRKFPFIVYTEERLEEKNIRLSYENYELRKKNYLNRINAIIEYASTKNKCRSQILLNYFDQKNVDKCMQCDVCREKKEQNLSKDEFDSIFNDIKSKLLKKTWIINDLISECNFKEEKILIVLRWLTENNKLTYIDEIRIKWNTQN